MKNFTIMVALVATALFAGLFASAPAQAQNCGPGMVFNPAHTPTNGQPVCIPGNDWGPMPSAPQGRWETRWGAFAGDDETGAVGMAGSMSSKGKATRAAIAHCRSKGGVDCRLKIAYYNQCGVVTGGEHDDGTWDTRFQSAATLEEASGLALDKCRRTGAKRCEVVFSGCSYAEFVN